MAAVGTSTEYRSTYFSQEHFFEDDPEKLRSTNQSIEARRKMLCEMADEHHSLITIRLCGRIMPLCVSSSASQFDLTSELHVLCVGSDNTKIVHLGERLCDGGGTVGFAPVLQGGVSGAANNNTTPCAGRRSVKELLQKCAAQVHRIQTIACAGKMLPGDKCHGQERDFPASTNLQTNYAALDRAKSTVSAMEIQPSKERDGEISDACPDLNIQPLTEKDEDEEIARALFAKLAQSCGLRGGDILLPTDTVREEARRCSSVGERALLEALDVALRARLVTAGTYSGRAQGIPFVEFCEAFASIPRVRGERVRWAGTLGLDKVLARLLRPGDAFDGLRGLRGLSEEQLEEHVQEVSTRFVAALPGLIRKGLQQLRRGTAVEKSAVAHANAKFVVDMKLGQFADLDAFYKGAEELIGVPNPRIDVGISSEHCLRSNALQCFTSPNYNVETWPKQEWEVVVCPVPGKLYPHAPKDKKHWTVGNTWYGDCGRDVVGIDNLLATAEVREKVERAGLRREEVICLRLYSGPMFTLYNAVMRGLPQRDVDCLKGNKYETTIFTITSGITKLSKITAVPQGRLLYRGLGGDLVLPDPFWRNLSEFRVGLTVHARGSVSASTAESALRARVMKDSNESQCGFLGRRSRLIFHSPPDPAGSEPSGAEGRVEARIVTAPHVDGDHVRLVVALLASRQGLAPEDILGQFVRAVRACCAAAGQIDVTVDEVNEIPADFRGGVEQGMLSLTASKETAMQYGKSVRGKRGTVFELQVGRVDVGASIEFLSQYPGELEYLMPPLSCLEVIGEPRLETDEDAEVVVIPLRVNVNLKSFTVEDIIARRKRLHSATAKNLKEELAREANERVEELDRLLQQRRHGQAEHLRGNTQHVKIDLPTEQGAEAHFSGQRWAAIWAPYLMCSVGQFYFEVEVIEATGQLAVGFIGTRCGDHSKSEIGDDNISWGVYSFDKIRHDDEAEPLPEPCTGWFVSGAVLGLAVDFGTGRLLAKVRWPDEDKQSSSGGGWVNLNLALNVKPGQIVGGGLVPVIAGGWGAHVKYNFGHTTMRHHPPTDTYKSFSNASNVVYQKAGDVSSKAGCGSGADTLLEKLGVGRSTLFSGFHMVLTRHEASPPEEYNDDVVYKDLLNEIIDTKVCSEKKQEVVVSLLKAGGVPELLKVVISAPLTDFRCQSSLEAECPGYSWLLIFSGWFDFLDEVHIPLQCAPCLIALIWNALFISVQKNSRFEGRTVKACIGAKTGRIVQMDHLIPTLRVESLGLQSQRFEFAILGLVRAGCRPGPGRGNSMEIEGALTCLDFRGLEYSNERKQDIALAIADGMKWVPIREVNGLVVEHPNEGQNLRFCVRRTAFDSAGLARKNVSVECERNGRRILNKDKELGLYIDAIDWSFVTGEAACGRWSSLNMSQNSIDELGSKGLSIGLGAVTALTVLDLSNNLLNPAGATAISGALTTLLSLVQLELGCNNIGSVGGTAVAWSLCFLTSLKELGLSDNKLGTAGATNICNSVSALSSLTQLDLSTNALDESGGEAVLSILQKLPSLRAIGLKGQDLGSSVWPILEELATCIVSLRIAHGSVTVTPARNEAKQVNQVKACCGSGLADSQSKRRVCSISLHQRQALGPCGSLYLEKVLCGAQAGALLTVLELDHNRIGIEGAKALAPVLFRLSTLTRLGLSFNEIGLAGSHSIAEGLGRLSELCSLSLEGNGFGCAGWSRLAPCLDCMPFLTFLNGHDHYSTLRSSRVSVLNLSNKEQVAAVSNLLPRSCDCLTDLDVSNNDFCSQHIESQVADTDKALHTLITGFGVLYALTSLNLSDNVLGIAGSTALGIALISLSLLTVLKISRTELHREGATAVTKGLRQLTALQDLGIAGNRIGAAGAFELCSVLSVPASLMFLDIGNNCLGPEGATSVTKSLCSLSRLVRLESPQNSFGPDGGYALGAMLTCLHALTMLDLHSNQLGGMGCTMVCNALAEVAAKPPALLQTLNLSYNSLSNMIDNISSVIAGLAKVSALETLIIDGNSLEAKGAEAVVDTLSDLTALHTLKIGDNKLGQAGGTAFGNCLVKLTALRSLHLESNGLGTFGGAAVVKGITNLVLLRILDLCDNALCEKVGETIGVCLSLITSLETLNLEGNQLGPLGGCAVARGVASLPCLQVLDLRDNSIGPDSCRNVALILSHIDHLHLDLRCNDLERRGRGKHLAYSYSRLRLGHQASQRRLSIAGVVPQMIIRGWLKKLNKVNEGEWLEEANWRDRLCFVKNNKMYYKSAKKKGEDEEVAELSKIHGVHAVQDGLDQGLYMFHVEVNDQRKMVFSANSADDRNQWIAVLTSRRTAPPAP